MVNAATYYEHPNRTIGLAFTDQECAAYKAAGFFHMVYKEACRFSRAQIKNPELGYRWTVGGPENFVSVQDFRKAMP